MDLLIQLSRGVPIISTVDISAANKLIQITKEADTSVDVALSKLIFI